MGFEHQDWNTVTFKKKRVISSVEQKEKELRKSAYNYAIRHESEDFQKPKTTKLSIRNFIKKARNERKLSQSEVARLLNIQQNIYNNWESGKEPIPGNYISKLNTHLKINIKKGIIL